MTRVAATDKVRADAILRVLMDRHQASDSLSAALQVPEKAVLEWNGIPPRFVRRVLSIYLPVLSSAEIDAVVAAGDARARAADDLLAAYKARHMTRHVAEALGITKSAVLYWTSVPAHHREKFLAKCGGPKLDQCGRKAAKAPAPKGRQKAARALALLREIRARRLGPGVASVLGLPKSAVASWNEVPVAYQDMLLRQITPDVLTKIEEDQRRAFQVRMKDSWTRRKQISHLVKKAAEPNPEKTPETLAVPKSITTPPVQAIWERKCLCCQVGFTATSPYLRRCPTCRSHHDYL